MSLIGAASMALALLVGCGDDDAKPVSSQAGQSCVRTADCASGLSCIANTCYKTPPKEMGSAGETSVTPPVGPVLGSEGESCTARTDCADGLGCFNNRCTAAEPMGDGGAPSTPPGVQLGARGESCRVNGDCAKSLVCVPSVNVAGTGTCDVADFGLKPTGMKCTGECTKAADCCQFPVALHTADIQSCQDIDDALAAGPIDCTKTLVTAAAKKLCFEKATYCECGAKTWTCSDTNTCVYGTACAAGSAFDVPTGCPSNTRLHALVATCNPDTLKCVGPTLAAGCTTDAKCEGVQIVDSTFGDVCTADECTCYAGQGCYRKCASDIECGTAKKCDTKSKVCVPDTACSTDQQCAIANVSLAYKCNKDSGTCGLSCAVDRDCSGTGLNGSFFNGMVCGADGFCASLATDCVEGTQCPAAAGALKPFCVEVKTTTGVVASSAITH